VPISYLVNPKRGRKGENEKTRKQLSKDCFFHFHGYQTLPKQNIKLKLKYYKGFGWKMQKKHETAHPNHKGQMRFFYNYIAHNHYTKNCNRKIKDKELLISDKYDNIDPYLIILYLPVLHSE
jgi:hypothetical protein